MICRPPLLPCILGCVMTMVAASCSSSKKNEEPEGAKISDLNRFMDKGFDPKKGQFDSGIRSQFDQKNYSAGKTVNDQRFRTDSFAGKHDYTGSSTYKEKEFSQSDKTSREGGRTYAASGRTPEEANESYETKDSRYGSQQARQGDQSFAGGDESYKTREVRDAAKSQKKNVKPEIIPKDDESDKPAYSEAEVRRMVNRN